MSVEARLTVPEISDRMKSDFGRDIPVWKIRRVVDSLEKGQKLDVRRFVNYRTILESDLSIVVNEFRRIHWLAPEAIAAAEHATC